MKSDRIKTIQSALENLHPDELAFVATAVQILSKNPTFDTAQVWEIYRGMEGLVKGAMR